MHEIIELSVTIADATPWRSAAVDLKGHVLVGLTLPSGWVNAAVNFQVESGGTYTVMTERDSTELTITAPGGNLTAPEYYALDPDLFWGAEKIKVGSGTAGTPVDQTEARTLILHLRRFDY